MFWTSFWFEDYLNEKKYRSAKTVLISSASSKTAFCLAYRIQKRKLQDPSLKVTIVGLTSDSNLAFAQKLGLYDTVHTYSSLPSLPIAGSYVYVDIAGNPSLNTTVAKHVNPVLTVSLGKTNVDEGSANDLQGGTANDGSREFFFMPEWLAVRKTQLSIFTITTMQGVAWRALMEDCAPWVSMQRSNGPDQVLRAYERTLKNKVGPNEGLVFSLGDKEGHKGKL